MSKVLVIGRSGQSWQRSVIDSAQRAGLQTVECDSMVDILVRVDVGRVEAVVLDESFPRLAIGLPELRSKTRVVVVGTQRLADVDPADIDLTHLLSGAEGSSASARVTAIWGPPGSWGVTTVAAELARSIADREVLLIDANVHAPGVAAEFGLPAGGLLQACLAADRGAVERPIGTRRRPAVLTGVDPGLYPAVTAGALRQVIDAARADFDHVLLDLDSAVDPAGEIGLVPDWTTATAVGLSEADHVVIVTGDSPVALRRLWWSLPTVAGLVNCGATVVINRCRNPRRAGKEVVAGLADHLPDCALGWISGPVTAKSLAPIISEIVG